MDTRASLKRKAEDEPSTAIVVAKKQKTSEIVAVDEDEEHEVMEGAEKKVEIKRTSSLKAPIMLLTGHEAEILSVKFSPDGQSIASAGRDKLIYLWNVYDDCTNYSVLKGHKNAVLEVCWSSDNKKIYSASSDRTIGVWDANNYRRLLRLNEHTNYVNAISIEKLGDSLFASCSDDNTAKLWDSRSKKSTKTFEHEYPVTAVALNEEKSQIFTGGLDNEIRCWDIRAPETPVYTMKGHNDTITSLRIDPYNSYLLSNSFDSSVRIWDVRPFAPQQRCVKIFTGATHGLDKSLIKASWAKDGSMVGAGSADKMVLIWDTTSRNIKYRLPGHAGSVNEVDFHPKEPIIVSCSNDKKIYLGEIED